MLNGRNVSAEKDIVNVVTSRIKPTMLIGVRLLTPMQSFFKGRLFCIYVFELIPEFRSRSGLIGC